jgi:excisionase family DNA binding protein
LERLTLSVPEAARLLGVSRMSAYSAVREGTIPSIRIGRRVLVPRAALDRLLDGAGSTVTQGTAEPQQRQDVQRPANALLEAKITTGQPKPVRRGAVAR